MQITISDIIMIGQWTARLGNNITKLNHTQSSYTQLTTKLNTTHRHQIKTQLSSISVMNKCRGGPTENSKSI